jgi:beta-xylosidase
MYVPKMYKFLFFITMFVANKLATNIVASNPNIISNPITKGLHPYGMRDFNIFIENKTYYLLGTEMAKPGTDKRGVVLYKSNNMIEWTEVAVLIDRKKLKPDCWYYDDFKSPKISKIRGNFYLTFSANNTSKNPYGSTGVVIAVADKIEGSYKILTTDKPIALGNNFSLNVSKKNEVFAYWDKDGKIFCAEMQKELLSFKNSAFVAIDQQQLRSDDHFLDAPTLYSDKGVYYLLYSVFKGGYRISYAISKSFFGRWTAPRENDIYYRSEDQASTQLKMTYPMAQTYAPPCEIIGHAQLFTDLNGKLRLAYHSEDKYAEPFLSIDYAEIIDGKVICKPTLK